MERNTTTDDQNDTETEYETVRDGWAFSRRAYSKDTIGSSMEYDYVTTNPGDKIKVEFLTAYSGYEDVTEITGRIVECYARHITILRDDRETVTVEHTYDDITGDHPVEMSLLVKTNGRTVGKIETDPTNHGISFLVENFERVPVESDEEDSDDDDNERHGTTETSTGEVLTAESRAFVVQSDGVHGAREWATPDEEGILRDEDGMMYGVQGWHVERVDGEPMTDGGQVTDGSDEFEPTPDAYEAGETVEVTYTDNYRGKEHSHECEVVDEFPYTHRDARDDRLQFKRRTEQGTTYERINDMGTLIGVHHATRRHDTHKGTVTTVERVDDEPVVDPTDGSDEDDEYRYNLELHTQVKKAVSDAIECTEPRDCETPVDYRNRVTIAARVFLLEDLAPSEIFGHGTELLDAAIENTVLTQTDPWEKVTDEPGRNEWRHGDKRISLIKTNTGWLLDFEEFDEHRGVVTLDIEHGNDDDRAHLRYKAGEWMVNNRE